MRNLRSRIREKGSMLIVALGVLALMGILAATFATLMRMEKFATVSYKDSVRSKAVADCGIEHAVSVLKQAFKKRMFSSDSDPTAPMDESGKEIYGRSLEERSFEPRISGYTGSTHGDAASAPGDVYKVKVFSCASQINLNGHQDTLGDMLTVLGEELQRKGLRNPFPPELKYVPPEEDPKDSGLAYTAGKAVISFRNSLADGRFRSKAQLKELIGQEAYEVVKDYVTAVGWRDEHAVVGVPNQPVGGADYSYEDRYPVDVNSASMEVLTALLDGVGGRFKWVAYGDGPPMRPVGSGSKWARPSFREETELRQQVIWMYIKPITREQARGIAEKLVIYRKSCGGSITSQQQLYDFFDSLDSSLLPGYDECLPMNQRDIPQGVSVNEIRSSREFRLHHDKAVRSMLKANFNPNGNPNQFNPNLPAYLPVSKGDLFKKADHTNLDIQEAVSGHTTEFCFGSMGYFEITSLGRIYGPREKSGSRVDVWAQSKVRQVVKIFEVKRHTTQFEFEHPDAKKDGFTTFPEPVPALRKLGIGGASSGTTVIGAEDETIRGDKACGYVELEPTMQPYHLCSLKFFRASFKDGFDADVGWKKTMDTLFFEDVYDTKPPVPTPIMEKGVLVGSASANNDLFPDGINQSILRHSNPRVCLYRARARANTLKSDLTEMGNVGFRAGAIEMWIKPEFDTSQKIWSGYFAATNVMQNLKHPSGRNGIQMYFYKNSDGVLRVTRLYYEVCYDERGQLLPRGVDLHDRDNYPPSPDAFCVPDETIQYPRMDLYVEPKHYGGWKAHEWHHVFISWNDTKAFLKMWIDGREMDTPEVPSGHMGRGEFVHLNCRLPSDEFQLGGIFRFQQKWGTGLLPFSKGNWVMGASNATIRDVITYHLEKEEVDPKNRKIITRNFVPNSGEQPNRYWSVGTYMNKFKIDFPPGVNKVKLGSVSWTTYRPPAQFGGHEESGSQPKPVDNMNRNLMVKVKGVPVNEPGNALQGGEYLVSAEDPYVTYSVTFMPYSLQTESRDVFSPVLDDITISYFLPREKVVLFEKIVE